MTGKAHGDHPAHEAALTGSLNAHSRLVLDDATVFQKGIGELLKLCTRSLLPAQRCDVRHESADTTLTLLAASLVAPAAAAAAQPRCVAALPVQASTERRRI
jgi:hypothetical protein